MDRPVHRPRLINRRQQGDLGEASAIEWLTRMGAGVWVPFGHSPDADLLAEVGGALLRVQVKTSTMRRATPNGYERWCLQIATNGGNQSWSGVAKLFDPAGVDYLFALVGDGRRWFIPAQTVEGRSDIMLGGPKYAEFEIDRGHPIMHLIYGGEERHLELTAAGERRRGRVGLDCKSSALAAEWVRIPPPPSGSASDNGDRPGRIQRTRISANHQVTIPTGPFRAADLGVGDRLFVEAVGEGEVRLKRIEPPGQLALPDDLSRDRGA